MPRLRLLLKLLSLNLVKEKNQLEGNYNQVKQIQILGFVGQLQYKSEQQTGYEKVKHQRLVPVYCHQRHLEKLHRGFRKLQVENRPE